MIKLVFCQRCSDRVIARGGRTLGEALFDGGWRAGMLLRDREPCIGCGAPSLGAFHVPEPEPPPPPPHDDAPPGSFCSSCVVRAAGSLRLVRALMELALETVALHARAYALLWDIKVADLEMVKQLRVMFTAEARSPRARASELLAALDAAGVRPH